MFMNLSAKRYFFFIYNFFKLLLWYKQAKRVHVFNSNIKAHLETLLIYTSYPSFVPTLETYWGKFLFCSLPKTYNLIKKKKYIHILNRPGVAGAVLKTSLWLIHSLNSPFPPNLQNIINQEPKELGSWHFERMFTHHNMSHVMCSMFFVCLFLLKWWRLSMLGLLSTGPNPSSCLTDPI